MTDDIRKELRDMGLYPSKANDKKPRDSHTSPSRRSKRAAISSYARRWIGRDGVPEIPYQLEASVRKWKENFISTASIYLRVEQYDATHRFFTHCFS